MLMNDRGMSSDLRGKLALFLYKDVIQGVSLFERVDDTFLSKICMEVSERSERAFWKTSILAMKCAKWLQT
tara:strand:- start:511 stop:723 length:213 start_codon:yes stop_codon:yes gene_type:complete